MRNKTYLFTEEQLIRFLCRAILDINTTLAKEFVKELNIEELYKEIMSNNVT